MNTKSYRVILSTHLWHIATMLAERYGKEPRQAGADWITHCPCHDDQNGCLSVGEKNGGLVASCDASCVDQNTLVKTVLETCTDWFDSSSTNGQQPALPVPLPVNLAGIPEYLKQFKQWVLWKWVWKEDKQKWDKIPYQLKPNGEWARSNNPSTWYTFKEVAGAYATGEFSGVGFCVYKGDGLVIIDLDMCFDVDGKLKEWAREIVDRFKNTFIEKSPSGFGLHIWCLGNPLDKQLYSREIKWANPGFEKDQGLENLDSGSNKYCTVTGVVYE